MSEPPIALPPERHIDASDAALVAWAWIDALAADLVKVEDRAVLEITTEPWGAVAHRQSSTEAVILWRRGSIFAVAFLIRDAWNWTQLIRWQAEALP